MTQAEHTQEPQAPTAPATLDECQALLADVRREADELRDKYIRAVAEAENARKWAKRDAQARATEQQRWLLRQLLDVADNLERALSVQADLAELRQGVELTLRQFTRVLTQAGVERLVVEPGQPFDPRYHEPVEVQPGDVPEDTVVEVVQAGYRHEGAVLRPARVVVIRRPS